MTDQRPRPIRVLRIVVGLLVFLVGLGIAATPRTPATAQSGTVENLGDLALPGKPACDFANGDCTLRVYPEPATRLLYVFQPRWLGVYDLDSLQLIGSLDPGPFEPSFPLADSVSSDLFLFGSAPPAGTPPVGNFTNGPRLLRVGIRNGALVQLASVDLTANLGGAATRVVGGQRVGTSTRMLLLLNTVITTGYGVALAELDFAALGNGSVVVDWLQDVSSNCTLMRHAGGSAGIVYVPRTKAVYFGCGAVHTVGIYQTPQGAGVGKLPLDGDPTMGRTTPGTLEKFVRAADFSSGDSVADPLSGRIILSGFTAGANGITVYAFDGQADRFVGQFSGGNIPFQAVGIDQMNGRFYGHSQHQQAGLILSDVRPTPVSQGFTHPEFASRNGAVACCASIAVDPLTRRVFVHYADDLSRVQVLRDHVPPFLDPEQPSPDEGTTDIEEIPGKTGANTSGAGQGYGVRYRSIGGVQSALFNVAPFQEQESDYREMRGAYVNSANLANIEATASVISLDADEPTKTSTGNAGGWPYEAAQCSDFGNEPQTKTAKNASSECAGGSRRVHASAFADETAAGGFGVQRATTDVTIKRDALKGIVSTVTSTASGISITPAAGPVISIGSVSVTSTAIAKGRPGTARAEFSRTVSKVTVGGAEICPAQCTERQLVELVNAGSAGHVKIEFPEPDETFYPNGSPGGYQAIVRRDLADQLEAMFVENQPPDRIEVPGMVAAFIGDSVKTSRLVLELAGTEVEARYGITPADSDAGSGGQDEEIGVLALLGGDDPGLFSDPGGDLGSGGTGIGTGRGTTLRPSIPGGPLASQVAKLAFNGLRRALSLFPVWAVLLAPIYLSARRWLLLGRQALLSGGRT